jgi:hypothetical protein
MVAQHVRMAEGHDREIAAGRGAPDGQSPSGLPQTNRGENRAQRIRQKAG